MLLSSFPAVQLQLPLSLSPCLCSSCVSAAVNPGRTSSCLGWGGGDAGAGGEQQGKWDGLHTSVGQLAAGAT